MKIFNRVKIMFAQVIAEICKFHKQRENETWNEHPRVIQFSFSHEDGQNQKSKTQVNMNGVTAKIQKTGDDNF